MKKEMENNLYNNFPEMFVDRKKSLTESLMCFGFDCGDGWFDLIYNLCKQIQKTNPLAEFRVMQVKEKLGLLCFRCNIYTDEIRNLINEVWQKSAKVCEICGEDGKLRKRGIVLQTLCDKCQETKNL